MLRQKLIIAALATLVAAPALAPSAHAAARACKSHEIVTMGEWRHTWIGARISARRGWKHEASSKYGRKFSRWFVSQNHHYTCNSKDNMVRCTAFATPCQLGS